MRAVIFVTARQPGEAKLRRKSESAAGDKERHSRVLVTLRRLTSLWVACITFTSLTRSSLSPSLTVAMAAGPLSSTTLIKWKTPCGGCPVVQCRQRKISGEIKVGLRPLPAGTYPADGGEHEAERALAIALDIESPDIWGQCRLSPWLGRCRSAIGWPEGEWRREEEYVWSGHCIM